MKMNKLISNIICIIFCLAVFSKDARPQEADKRYLSDALTQEADTYYKAHDYDKATALLNEALSYNGDNINALILLGEVDYYSQDLEGAKKNWERALAIIPSSAVL